MIPVERLRIVVGGGFVDTMLRNIVEGVKLFEIARGYDGLSGFSTYPLLYDVTNPCIMMLPTRQPLYCDLYCDVILLVYVCLVASPSPKYWLPVFSTTLTYYSS